MSRTRTQLPYGTWPSRVHPETTGALRNISEPAWTASGELIWVERTSDQTYLMIKPRDDAPPRKLLPDLQVGGGLLFGGGTLSTRGDLTAAVVRKTSRVIIINSGDQQIREAIDLPGRAASPSLKPDGTALLFVHARGEQHSLQLIPCLENPHAVRLESKADFYNYPRWHPSGEQITWMSWDHPAMPWDSARIFNARIDRSSDRAPVLTDQRMIAGGKGVSVVQPEWSPDGKSLAYVSDKTGWWQMYLYDPEADRHDQLTFEEAEHGLPAWLQDIRTYTFSRDSRYLFFIRNREGFASLWKIDLKSGREKRIGLDEEYTWLESLALSPDGTRLAAAASSGRIPPRLITIDLEGQTHVIRRSLPGELPKRIFSSPSPVSWQSESGGSIHGLFYPPHNPDFTGPGKPPLLVIAHSGPTRQKWAEFQPRTQYFTSRGYAVLEVNYRGSTGYGRKYREALYRNWGVVDVADCVSGAFHLVEQGQVDSEKLAVLGSSAGGLTVLQSLIQHPGVFRAGITLYGVVNHLTLREITPKFERYYSDQLIGPFPEQEDRYRERSPLFSAGQIRDPVAVFQGGKDPVVPQEQAESIVKALRENGVPHIYVLYPGEGHGFKKSENIQDFFRRTESFLAVHLDLEMSPRNQGEEL